MKKFILLSACAISFGAFAQPPSAGDAVNGAALGQDKLTSAKAKAKEAKLNASDAKNNMRSDPMGSLEKAKASKENANGAVADMKSLVSANK